MAYRVHVDVVSAEEEIFSGEAELAVFPGESGELGILPHHAPQCGIGQFFAQRVQFVGVHACLL